MWPNQLGKPIEGDLGVDVDETELEFLGLDEQLPTEAPRRTWRTVSSASHAASTTRASPLATFGR